MTNTIQRSARYDRLDPNKEPPLSAAQIGLEP
jgi:hypothetical protein